MGVNGERKVSCTELLYQLLDILNLHRPLFMVRESNSEVQHYCKHMTLKHEWSDGEEACAACLCILTTAGFVYERSERLD